MTGWIEARANAFLQDGLRDVKRMPFEQALCAATRHRHDSLNAYVGDLDGVLDMDAIRGARVRMGVDPLGGAGIHYRAAIAERYRLDLTVVNDAVDPTFRFMTFDRDGQIRTDPSSSWAMQGLIGPKDHFDMAFACDTGHDRIHAGSLLGETHLAPHPAGRTDDRERCADGCRTSAVSRASDVERTTLAQ